MASPVGEDITITPTSKKVVVVASEDFVGIDVTQHDPILTITAEGVV